MFNLTQDALLISGVSLATVAAVGLALRRRQEQSILAGWAEGHGWVERSPNSSEFWPQLSASALLQIGHSRRFPAFVEDGSGVQLFEYAAETGAEHVRETHRWVGVLVPTARELPRAVFTNEAWVRAAASNPGFRRLALPRKPDAGQPWPLLWAGLEDEEAWAGPLDGAFGQRIMTLPAGQTLECLSNVILLHQPAPMKLAEIEELVSTAKETAKLLSQDR